MSLVFLLQMCQLTSSVHWGVYCTRHLLMESGGSMNVMFPVYSCLALSSYFSCISCQFVSFPSELGSPMAVLKSKCVFLTNVVGFCCLYFTV